MGRIFVSAVVAFVLAAPGVALAQDEPPERIRYRPGMPVYAGYHLEERPSYGLIGGGVAMMGGGTIVFVFGAIDRTRGGPYNFGGLAMVLGGDTRGDERAAHAAEGLLSDPAYGRFPG